MAGTRGLLAGKAKMTWILAATRKMEIKMPSGLNSMYGIVTPGNAEKYEPACRSRYYRTIDGLPEKASFT